MIEGVSSRHKYFDFCKVFDNMPHFLKQMKEQMFFKLLHNSLETCTLGISDSPPSCQMKLKESVKGSCSSMFSLITSVMKPRISVKCQPRKITSSLQERI